MPRGLKLYYGKGDLHFITFELLSAVAFAAVGARSEFVCQDSGRGAENVRIRAGGIRGNAGAHSSFD